jgi:hypothetical protein
MIRIIIPKDFEYLERSVIDCIVNKFISYNNDMIPNHEKYYWDKNWIFPNLFISILKENKYDFVIPDDISFRDGKFSMFEVRYLVKRFEENEYLKIRSKIKEKRKEEKRIRRASVKSINHFLKQDCEQINSGIFSCNPFKPKTKNGTITECERYIPKSFKFKRKEEAFAVFSNPLE